MGGKSPSWESELWSYVCNGDGERCPVYDYCQNRLGGGWCSYDNREYLNRLLDERQFDASHFNFIKEGSGKICQLVERLAQSFLRKNKIYYPPVLNEIISLADEQHPVEIRLIPLKSCHGAIWRLKKSWVIQLSNVDTPATQRFTLFHEAFHILAHCKGAPVFRQRGIDIGSFNEMLADCFAISILMPREWVMAQRAEVKDLDQLAGIFDVSKPVMCIRLKRLGLI